MSQDIRRGVALALFAAIMWGVSGTLGQYLFQQKGVDVTWLLTMRLLVSGVILLAYASRVAKADIWSIWKSRLSAGQLMVFSITGITAVQYTYFEAIKHSNAATATVLQFVAPVLIAIWLALRYRRIPQARELIAIILAVIGTVLLVTHGNLEQLTITRTALYFGLGSAIALAIYTLQPVPLLRRYGALPVLGWGMLIGALISSCFRAPWEVSGDWDLSTYLSSSYIIILGTAIAFLAYLNAVQLIGGQKTSLLASVEPLAATLLAVVWLQVPFGLMDWVGTLCIVSTVFLLTRP